jgi:exopolyphosphatase/guanosine-5'-triphosphate,3'-diphosphate pyrophosphatase
MAPNAGELAQAIKDRSGCELQVLSEKDEAELSFLGATSASELDEGAVVAVADVGGGSSELAVGRPGENPSWWRSLELGSAGLAREFLAGDPPSADEMAACRERAAAMVSRLEPPDVTYALAVGGSATSMRLLTGERLDDRALERALHLLSRQSAAEIALDHEIDIRRVKLLPAGIAILAAMSAVLGMPLHVARGGLREGVILRLATLE